MKSLAMEVLDRRVARIFCVCVCVCVGGGGGCVPPNNRDQINIVLNDALC